MQDNSNNDGPWPIRIPIWREIGWMIAAIVLGLIIIPAAIAVPFALLTKSESVFIWLLIGGAIFGGIVGWKFYRGILRRRALASGRLVRLDGETLTLPSQDAAGTPETYSVQKATSGWFSHHGGANSGRVEILWLLIESPRGSMMLITEGENLKAEHIQGVEQVEFDREKNRDTETIRMFAADLGRLIRRLSP